MKYAPLETHLGLRKLSFSSLFVAVDVLSGEERGETDVFAGYCFDCL